MFTVAEGTGGPILGGDLDRRLDPGIFYGTLNHCPHKQSKWSQASLEVSNCPSDLVTIVHFIGKLNDL